MRWWQSCRKQTLCKKGRAFQRFYRDLTEVLQTAYRESTEDLQTIYRDLTDSLQTIYRQFTDNSQRSTVYIQSSQPQKKEAQVFAAKPVARVLRYSASVSVSRQTTVGFEKHRAFLQGVELQVCGCGRCIDSSQNRGWLCSILSSVWSGNDIADQVFVRTCAGA